MSLPNDIYYEIFAHILPNDYPTWNSVMLCNKQFLFIARKVFDPSVENNKPLRMSASKGYFGAGTFGDLSVTFLIHEIVQYLLKDKRVDPCDDYQFALMTSSVNGHHLVVRELLKDGRVDPSAGQNEGK